MKIPEIKISVKYEKAKQSELYKISNSEDIYNLSKKVFNADTIHQSVRPYYNNRRRFL